jgi:hypothetical protein
MLGLVAALGMGASDLLMLGLPVSGRKFVHLGIANLAELPEWRLMAGAVSGVVFSTLYVPGFWHVAQAVGPAGWRRSFAMFCLFCATTAFGGAFHAAHGFVGVGLHAPATAAGDLSGSHVYANFDLMMVWLSSLGALALLGGSMLFTALVVTGRTLYPRWFAACSPFVLVLAFAVPGWLSPAPVGGYLWPVCFNLAMAVFFGLSLCLTWSRNSGIILPV